MSLTAPAAFLRLSPVIVAPHRQRRGSDLRQWPAGNASLGSEAEGEAREVVVRAMDRLMKCLGHAFLPQKIAKHVGFAGI